MPIKEVVAKLHNKKDLTSEEMRSVIFDILSGVVETADIISFLSLLNDKGETVEELTAAVEVMLKFVEPIIVDCPNILDTCGTGGDRKGTFNISTITAFVASGAGVCVAKHGNRSLSSKCGSADVLEELGIKINMERQKIAKCIKEIGIGFLFAPSLHPAMKNVMPARKEIPGKTMFNILGPLINPARATNQLIGVYDRKWSRVLAQVLHNLGTKHVMIVHGNDGLDEATTTDKTFICEFKGDDLREYEISPEDFSLKRVSVKDLYAQGVKENAQVVVEVLNGKGGCKRDIVLLNSGCAIYTADKCSSIKEGISLAQESIDSGKAFKKLQMLKEYSNS